MYMGEVEGLFSLDESPVRHRFGESDGSRGSEGAIRANVLGTTLHGVLESDGFRRWLLRHVASNTNKDYSPGPSYLDLKEEYYNGLAKWLVAATMDTEMLDWLRS